MDITVRQALLPHDDREASLVFSRDTLGFEVRDDVEYGGLQWITSVPPTSPATSPASRNCTEPPDVIQAVGRALEPLASDNNHAEGDDNHEQGGEQLDEREDQLEEGKDQLEEGKGRKLSH